ncbi:MAG: TlpA family protein disulfide reductase [Sedimentisphaerales bacterium]|nr:TlpA family protein disulfide reductase [Sedimentisphaerales bacterium]
MVDNNKKIDISFRVLLVFLILIVALIWVFGKKDPSVTTDIHTYDQQIGSTNEPASLETITKYARTWAPILHEWYGNKAPELVFNDLNGNIRKLSEYNGKNILLLFWGTWCAPCVSEIPGLIELRKTQSTDELAIIAISVEDPQIVKPFVQRRKINYDVATTQNRLNRPYGQINGFPSAFYIDKQGNFKLITEGAVSMTETLAIIKAKK